MAKLSVLANRGLHQSGRRISAGEKGYWTDCANVFVDTDGIAVSRYGLEITTSSDAFDRMWWDDINKQVIGGIAVGTATLKKLSGTVWTTLDSTSNRRYSGSVSSRNFRFVLTTDGLYRINAANSATEIGWVPEGWDLQVTTTGSTGWMPQDSQVAYRYVVGIKNANNEYFLGAPSGRVVVVNSAGGTLCNTSVVLTIPANITTDHFYQIYRTNPSAAAGIDPGDEMFLVYEDYFASTTAGATQTFTDLVPDSNGGTSLYSNQQQQTDTQQNNPCEASTGTYGEGGLSVFADCVWANNKRPRSSLQLSLLSVLTDTGLNARTFTATTNSSTTLTSVSSFTGLAVGQRISGTGIPVNTNITVLTPGSSQITISNAATASSAGVTMTAGDRLQIAGVEYLAWTSEDTSTGKFLVSTNTNAFRAVRETAESLVRVINRYSSNTVIFARYVSGPNEFPGTFLITARTDRASTYTAQANSHGTAFIPNITTAQTILSKVEPNRMVYSKPDEPQAWPTLNFIQVPEQATIVDHFALRNALMLQTDKGLYRISGTYGNFLLELVDRSQPAKIPSVIGNVVGNVVVDNVAVTSLARGFVAETEAGVTMLSDEVPAFSKATAFGQPALDPAHGLVFVKADDDYCFNITNRNWTKMVWPGGAHMLAGAYDYANLRMVFSFGSSVYRQRDPDELTGSYFDTTLAGNINSISGLVLTFASVPSGLAAGDVVKQSTNFARITAVNSNDVTVAALNGITTGAASLYVGYDCSMTYCPLGAPSFTLTKHSRYVNGIFDGGIIAGSTGLFSNTPAVERRVFMGFTTDIDTTERLTEVDAVTSPDNPSLVRFIVPAFSARSAFIVPRVVWRNCYNGTRWIGLELDYEDTSTSDKTRT